MARALRVLIALATSVLPVAGLPSVRAQDGLAPGPIPDGAGLQGRWEIAVPILIASTLLLVLLIVGIDRLHGRALDRIRRVGEGPEREVRLGKFRIRSADWIRSGLIHLVDLGRVLFVVIALGVYLPFALSLFEPTAGLARRTIDLAARNLDTVQSAVTGYLPNLVFVLVVGVIAWAGLKVLKALFTEIRRGRITIRGFYPSWAPPTYVLLRAVVIAFLLVLVLPKLPGFGSAAFEGISLFVGALVALGASSAMANAVSGVVLTYTRAFDVGDRVQIADTRGDVLERTLLVTRIRTIKNEDVTVPNAQVLSSHVVNYSGLSEDRPLIVSTEVSIGYDVPWRRVEELLLEAASGIDRVLEEPEPFVLQTDLGDFAVTYELNVYTEAPGAMTRLRSRLNERVRDTFAEADVEITSPTHTAFRRHEAPSGEALAPSQDEQAAAEEDIIPDAGELTEAERERLEEAESATEADEAAEEAWTEEGDGDESSREGERADDERDDQEPDAGADPRSG